MRYHIDLEAISIRRYYCETSVKPSENEPQDEPKTELKQSKEYPHLAASHYLDQWLDPHTDLLAMQQRSRPCRARRRNQRTVCNHHRAYTELYLNCSLHTYAAAIDNDAHQGLQDLDLKNGFRQSDAIGYLITWNNRQ